LNWNGGAAKIKIDICESADEREEHGESLPENGQQARTAEMRERVTHRVSEALSGDEVLSLGQPAAHGESA
jgi:hypothetical protein